MYLEYLPISCQFKDMCKAANKQKRILEAMVLRNTLCQKDKACYTFCQKQRCLIC